MLLLIVNMKSPLLTVNTKIPLIPNVKKVKSVNKFQTNSKYLDWNRSAAMTEDFQVFCE